MAPTLRRNAQGDSIVKRHCHYFFGALLCLVAQSVTASNPGEVPPTHHINENLQDLVKVEKLVASAEADLNAKAFSTPEAMEAKQRNVLGALQALATTSAFAGDTDGAIAAFDRKSRLEEQFYGAKVIGDERADLARINGSHAEDAVDAIGRAARDRQLVILNEAHHVPFDRVFAMRLARALRKEGFQYLACETFFIDDEHVLGNGYVAEKTGVYSREPMFVQFLMDAQKDGWKFVSYEPDVPGNLRESGMARNLVQRIFSIDAKAKVFVYAGYSHAKKVPASKKDNDESKLAAQLRRLTGIDPLTINQTTLYKHYDSEQQSRYYALAVKKLRSRQPAVLMDAQGKPIKLGIDDLAYDFEVVHPTYERDAVTGRYEWTNALPAQPRDIPRELLPAKGRRLVYAYRSASAADAAPYDVVLLKPGEPIPKFLLPAGDFVFEAED